MEALNGQPAPSLRQQMREFYQTSETYKKLLKYHDTAYLKTFVTLVSGHARSNSQLLEVGCGNGIASRMLAAQGHRVVGTDISPLFLQEAQTWQDQQLTYQIADAIELPFPNQHFDLVCSNELIEHVPDVEATLQEMIRVTKNGGRIIVAGPNLCSPITSVLDLLRLIAGGQGRPIWAETKKQAFQGLIRNIEYYFQKRSLTEPNFVFRQPDLENQIIGGDADSVYIASPIDLERFFENAGLSIVKLSVGFGLKGRLVATFFPRLSPYISMVIEKK